MPLILLWLVIAGSFFTVWMGFENVRGFRMSFDTIRGKYSGPEDAGEVSHFQALATAVSGTVGLGNIAGVAVAVSLGGPGATFWMILAGLPRHEHQDGRVHPGREVPPRARRRHRLGRSHVLPP